MRRVRYHDHRVIKRLDGESGEGVCANVVDVASRHRDIHNDCSMIADGDIVHANGIGSLAPARRRRCAVRVRRVRQGWLMSGEPPLAPALDWSPRPEASFLTA